MEFFSASISLLLWEKRRSMNSRFYPEPIDNNDHNNTLCVPGWLGGRFQYEKRTAMFVQSNNGHRHFKHRAALKRILSKFKKLRSDIHEYQ